MNHLFSVAEQTVRNAGLQTDQIVVITIGKTPSDKFIATVFLKDGRHIDLVPE